MTFSVALMTKLVANLAGLPRIASERCRASESGFELQDRAGLGWLVVLAQALCIYGKYS